MKSLLIANVSLDFLTAEADEKIVALSFADDVDSVTRAKNAFIVRAIVVAQNSLDGLRDLLTFDGLGNGNLSQHPEPMELGVKPMRGLWVRVN